MERSDCAVNEFELEEVDVNVAKDKENIDVCVCNRFAEPVLLNDLICLIAVSIRMHISLYNRETYRSNSGVDIIASKVEKKAESRDGEAEVLCFELEIAVREWLKLSGYINVNV